ncbi:dTMP kinase [Planococcus sp. CP5-4]|uniref:dTMP kinase n=1 Tax=unclassified Planococcus (in: firmicutes) TaxID=2662419 RepID=UPI001C23FA68|nr:MULTISPECIES: dTMP kinase [unclassified Planococcus (in: firmicutes)]MBU9674713.1 dTMP kinase [Planococcus sp. CP5-4_YE]MBV0910454.1 dTMP kinase [Planococcus sp. CP5-4_UN]MBW6064857.1 dTMP kinase [Planococcus sp. CP5-4]
MSYFITLEGGEGSGKTTALVKLAERLKTDGFEVLTTREPGGIEIAEKIREVILDRTHTAMDARTEALLYAAARRQHLVERVMPALQAGKIVLCDRFVDSSLAYQGHARGLGLDDVLAINEFAIEGHMPELTLYFDVNPKTGLARIDLDQGREFNRLDEESLAFHYKVREGYLLLLGRYPERMQLINAENELDEVVADAYEALQRFLAEKQ